MRAFQLLWVVVLAAHRCPPHDATHSVAKIRENVERAIGGDGWKDFAECRSERTIAFTEKTDVREDLRTGVNTSNADIPDLGVQVTLKNWLSLFEPR